MPTTPRTKVAAQITLADFYHRRLRPMDENQGPLCGRRAPADLPRASLLLPNSSPWLAFERVFGIITRKPVRQTFPARISGVFTEIRRTIALPSLPRVSDFAKGYEAATLRSAEYTSGFPATTSSDLKRKALVDYGRFPGSKAWGLRKNFQSLWLPSW